MVLVGKEETTKVNKLKVSNRARFFADHILLNLFLKS
jgi:hypothetical protein